MGQTRAGFTLIELMLVIALVGILSVLGIGSYTQATIKSRDTQRKNDINQMIKAIELYNNDLGSYPTSVNGVMQCQGRYGIVDCGDKITAYFSNATATYMDDVPADPISGRLYRYESEGSSFALYAALENLEDKDVVVDGSGNTTDWGVSCGSVNCNYKLTDTGLVRIKQ